MKTLKNTIKGLFLGIVLIPNLAGAQTPVVTGDNILCPNGTGVVTTQTFDSYQWLRRYFGSSVTNQISGANSQTLTMDFFNYAASYVSVITTLGSVTDTSDEYFVDGYAFGSPYVISNGNFTIGGNGESIVCPNDTMFFELGMPYNTNITWYKDGVAIPGQTSNTLTVTESGVYYVQGAPSQCPQFLQGPGVTLEVNVLSFAPLSISTTGSYTPGPSGSYVICQGDSVVFNLNAPFDSNISWYNTGNPINGANDDNLVVYTNGIYTVKATPNACPDYIETSDPMIVEYCAMSVEDTENLNFSCYPNPTTAVLNIESTSGFNYEIYNINGQLVANGNSQNQFTTINVADFPNGIYSIVFDNKKTYRFQKL